MAEKIGVGIITCNRPDFVKRCIDSLYSNANEHFHEAVLINDGKEITDYDLSAITVINNETNLGVGKSKNRAFKYLLGRGCDHIFLVEDDILIKNIDVFQAYIEARYVTGIQHFMFGYHGPANKNGISGGKPVPRYIVDYGNNLKIAINGNSVGAFCYYTREVLENVGLIDEDYSNAFEHVDHDYRIAKAGYCTPYWNWPDLSNSIDYLEEIECSEKNSSIRPRNDWKKNIIKGTELFQKKHGYMPAYYNFVPDTTKDDVISFLRKIKPKSKA